jgi:delta 1-pyrroline-5-carboxylate dehydrogenase
MSGVGSKAGGADYLLQFVEPRACAENTMRRGFAPGLFDAGSPSQMQSATAETAGGF